MLSKYKEFMDSLVSKIKKNGSGHSVILTTQDNGYILEVFSRTAFDGLAESLFMTASDQGMTVCLEENLCASDHSLKKIWTKDFNDNTQAVIEETSKLTKSYMPRLNL